MRSMTPLPPASTRRSDGGVPARRAVVRWAWRLFAREWRQQLLIFALITVAVAGTILGSAVAADNPPPKDAGFGTAQDSVSFPTSGAHSASVIADLHHRFGRVEVIENETLSIPGSVETFQLRSESARGPFTGPMLSLVSGRYPRTGMQVAVTRGVATAFHLTVGKEWRLGGVSRTVVGIVENPQSLLDEFALLEPGQVAHPTSVTALFDADGARLGRLASEVQTPSSVAKSNVLNPETISLAALVLGMLLITLVSVGGFTVLAQRRLRSIGMLEATGASDRHVRLVVSANGAVVGIAGAIAGFVLGLVLWLAYRPSLEQSSHHLIGVLAIPWIVVAAALVLAVLASYFAASRPARTITKVPIVTALSGRPAPPRQVRRSAVPGILCLVAAVLLLGYAGGSNGGSGSGASPELALGILFLIPGLILLAPFFLSLVARLGTRSPIATRLALRDLARYRSRSGSALAAISVGVLVAVIIMIAAASRYGNVFDWAGPNLAPNQLALHYYGQPQGQPVTVHNGHRTRNKGKAPRFHAPRPPVLARDAATIARRLGGTLVPLVTPGAGIAGEQGGRQWTGAIYVATPRLLRAFGIKQSEINPKADIVSSRPGLAGVPGIEFSYGGNCTVPTGCQVKPVIQYLGALPTGTSAPNTLVTEHAMRQFHISTTTTDWLLERPQPFTASQIAAADLAASTTPLSVESKNDEPSSSSVIGWATIFGILIALGVLGMSAGLVRSETAGELRTLTATGASSHTRRALAAATVGALGFIGALLGTFGGYLGMIGWLRSNSLNGGISALGNNVPVAHLLLILIAMPAAAAAAAWIFAGREPAAVTQQAFE